MNTETTYRPAHIEFDVATDDTIMPETLGKFDKPEEAIKFIGGNLVITNAPLTVARHMDNFEKNELRKKYNAILEDALPHAERERSEKEQIFNDAKKELADANATVQACEIEAKTLAKKVKRGTVEIRLDEDYTFRVPYRGRFYFYTYIDKEIRLVHIRDMAGSEKQEIFSASAENETFIEKFVNGETESQAGEKK